ncbi:hypothetical protein KIPB_014066 [Kipferlia bialata]|uniref:Uncharacterized protein n=1 Tax=Kipferlia bialata TaxID=797122 RepID=A0A391P9R9_9EUKA|nr:hypothetical protein KIPB_014066 [Kipferlia bialata]|eukprot:g14066.t1
MIAPLWVLLCLVVVYFNACPVCLCAGVDGMGYGMGAKSTSTLQDQLAGTPVLLLPSETDNGQAGCATDAHGSWMVTGSTLENKVY